MTTARHPLDVIARGRRCDECDGVAPDRAGSVYALASCDSALVDEPISSTNQSAEQIQSQH